ncbi:MAG TPA: hypothetical protein VD967_00140 [Candidatus Paceibacterota bacterium]|nr:hypothetical protein [Candidatus Paceibacterota bacterium]
MATFPLTVAKLDEVLFRGNADEVILPGEAGEMAVLAHHMPLVTLLKEGVVRVKHGGKEESFPIKGGTAEINSREVTVLVR